MTNQDYWRPKIEANRLRDAETNEALHALGWTVIRVWEHEDPDAAAKRIADTVHSRRERLQP